MIDEQTHFGGSAYLPLVGGSNVAPLGARVCVVSLPTAPATLRLPAAGSGRMAPAYGLSVGPFAYVVNLGPNALTVEDSTGATSIAVPSGYTARCVLDAGGLLAHDVTISRLSMTPLDAIVCGGMTTGGSPAESSTVEKLDYPGDTWSTAASMATARANGGGGSAGQEFYVAGAVGGSTAGERYADDAWSALPGLSSAREHVLSGWARSRIHFFGGDATDSDAYDPISQTMSAIAALPMARESGSAVSLPGHDRVLLYAGLPALSPPWSYHAASDTYETLPAATGQDRRSTSALARDGRAWVCGGYEDATSTTLDLVETFDPVTRVWAAGPSLPAARTAGSAWAIHESGYFACGYDSSGSAANDVYRIDAAAWAGTTAKTSATVDAANQAGAVR